MPVFGWSFSLETAYWVMAGAGTALFVLKVLLLLIGIGGEDLDVGDVGDAGGDVGDAGASGATFAVWSLQSVLAFFMGVGWMGLACMHEWHLGSLPTFFISVTFGIALMFASAWLMSLTRKFDETSHVDVQSAVGATGKVYLPIPASGEGTGQVELDVSGRRMIMTAKSAGGPLKAFQLVKVREVSVGDILVVEPQD